MGTIPIDFTPATTTVVAYIPARDLHARTNTASGTEAGQGQGITDMGIRRREATKALRGLQFTGNASVEERASRRRPQIRSLGG